jgi:hypothetical protein
MAQWDSGVNPPAGGRYAGSLINFGELANWGPDDPAKLRQEQEAKAFQQGLPIDPRTQQTDFKSVAATALKYGGFPLLERLAPFIQQQEQNQGNQDVSRLYGGGVPVGSSPQGAPIAAPMAAPASSPAAAPRTPLVGGIAGSVIDMVNAVLPGARDTADRVAGNIARLLGVATNQTLSPDKADQAQRYVSSYAQGNGLAGAPVSETAIDNYGRMIKKRESGSAEGDYRAVGPIITNRNSPYYGDRAYGAYQVMGRNIPEWTQEVLGRPLTIEQFVNSKEAQDAVFRAKFGGYVAQTGSPRDAASMWFRAFHFLTEAYPALAK